MGLGGAARSARALGLGCQGVLPWVRVTRGTFPRCARASWTDSTGGRIDSTGDAGIMRLVHEPVHDRGAGCIIPLLCVTSPWALHPRLWVSPAIDSSRRF